MKIEKRKVSAYFKRGGIDNSIPGRSGRGYAGKVKKGGQMRAPF